MSVVLKFSKAVPEAYIPIRQTPKSAGFDLRSAYNYIVPLEGKAIIDTGIKVALPEGCYGRIAPRSGLAVKYFINVGGKCILLLNVCVFFFIIIF